MAGTLTLDEVLDGDVNYIKRRYKFVPSGSYVNGSGETINFLTAANPGFRARPVPPGPPAAPLPNENQAIVTKVPAGYDAVLLPAASTPTLANFNLRFYTSGGTELGSGAYPAGLLDNTVIEVTTDKKYN